jgi:predicted Zn finger-like uncharacterized protein
LLIVCPSCASSYWVTRDQLPTGRMVRCAACRTTWFANPTDEEDAAPLPSVPDSAGAPERASDDGSPLLRLSPEPEPVPDLDPPAPAMLDEPPPPEPGLNPPVRKSAKMRLPRLALPRFRIRITPVHIAGAALVALVVVGATMRNGVVRLMPQTARLYAALGAPVNLRGLEIAGLRSELVSDKEQSVLVVEGEIRGVAAGTTSIPRLAVSLRGKDGQDLYSWTSEVARPSLGKGETVPFRTRLAAPPAGGQDVLVRFAEAEPRSAEKPQRH